MDYLVLDIGGTAVKHAMMNDAYDIWGQGSIDEVPDNHDDFMATIAGLYREAGSPAGGIAISYCGIVDPETAYVSVSGSYPFNNGCSFRDELAALCGAGVSMDNDARCAAKAEIARGALEGKENGLIFVIGTALGGCVVRDGKVLEGSHGVQSAFLSIISDVDADIASATGPEDAPFVNRKLRWRALIDDYAAQRGADDPLPHDGKAFFDLVDAGDELACTVLRRYACRFAQLIWSLQVVFDVETVAIGGGISAAPALVQTIDEEVTRAFTSPLVPLIGIVKPEVTRCAFRNDANLIGALAHRMSQQH